MPLIDARFYKCLVICPNREMATEVGPLIAHGLPLAPFQIVADYPIRRPLLDLLKSSDAKICFLDFATNRDFAFQCLGELQSANPLLPVVALLHTNHPDLILQCLRQGATDFLMRPFTNDQIDAAVEKIIRTMPAANGRNPSGGKLIAVVPAKGACGATTVACNLAFQSKRIGLKKILLADLDPITGTISFLLKLKSPYSFLDVLTRGSSLDGDLWKQMITTSQGIDVLLPPESVVDGLEDLRDVTPIADFAQRMYEVAIIDCGNAYSDWNLSIARAADEILLTTTNEMPALQAAQRALANFDLQKIDPAKIRLLVNRYDRDVGLGSDLIPNALGTEVFQVIPSDYEAVQKSVVDGKPIPISTLIGKNLAALADKVCIKPQKPETEKKTTSMSGLRSMFSRT